MKKIMSFAVLMLLFSLLPAQQNRQLYLESGTSVYAPLQTRQHLYHGVSGVYISDYNVNYKPAAGVFLNIGYEQRVAGKKNIFFSVPFVFGYRNQQEKLDQAGYSYGDFTSFKGTEYIAYQNHMVGFSAGAKLNYSYNKMSCFVALVCHNELMVMQKYTYRSEPDNGLNAYQSVTREQGTPDDFYMNLSIQTGFMYKFRQNWSAGIVADCYMYNVSQPASPAPAHRQMFNLSVTQGISAAVFNPGIRISRHF